MRIKIHLHQQPDQFGRTMHRHTIALCLSHDALGQGAIALGNDTRRLITLSIRQGERLLATMRRK